MKKICSKCKIEKELNHFYNTKRGNKDGKHSHCKTCCLQDKKKHRENNIDKYKEKDIKYYKKNKSKIIEKVKVYYENNKSWLNEKRKEPNKIYRIKNKERFQQREKEYRKEYRYKNKEAIKQKEREYYYKNKKKKNSSKNIYDKQRCKIDIQYKLKKNLRIRLCTALKRNYKAGSAVSDLGCSIEKFKLWLEMNWIEGMSWDNYGKNGWHIDHIVPISKFDLTDRKQLLEACYFSNLQPLWAKDNLIKSDKIL